MMLADPSTRSDRLERRDVLFELGTEELPPRTLSGLSNALAEGVVKGLAAAGVEHGRVHVFATPRRLAVRLEAVTVVARERRVERRGPPVSSSFDAQGEPTPAASAFAKSCGVTVGDLERLTTAKGAWLAFRAMEAGAPTESILGSVINQAIAALPIAKRMRWGAHDAEFVRPVRSVVLMLGSAVIPAQVLGFTAGRTTFGHRYQAPQPFDISTPESYESQLHEAKVVADFAKRRALIRAGVQAVAAKAGGIPHVEEKLLDEVTALVEWPVPIAGRFEERFLALPREVVIATVQDHQRYFAVENHDGRLNGGFVTVSNIDSRDPSKVQQGNERVVRPRLSDAAFFWEQDLKIPLQAQAERLSTVTFQTQLGSYADKTQRVRRLAGIIGARLGADAALLERAAELAKADLMTAMVGEFPELQGTMGRYYALAQGEPAELALALEEHYKPRYAGDPIPQTLIGRTLALADKLDTLVGIFAIGQRPTGNKDPFGLRRAALGVLRILLEGRIDLDLTELLTEAAGMQPVRLPDVAVDVREFVTDRLRGLMLERADGTTVEMIDAVLAASASSPLDVDARVQALKAFTSLPEAAVLAAINKRVANILRKAPSSGAGVSRALLAESAEIELDAALQRVREAVHPALAERRYAQALAALTELRTPVDRFFEHILVMDENLEKRNSRLALLRDLECLLGGVANLSRLPG